MVNFKVPVSRDQSADSVFIKASDHNVVGS